MAWIHSNHSELNNFDIFAFVNMKEKIFIKGRLCTLSDGSRAICNMNNKGEVRDIVALPEWATVQPEEALMRLLFEEIGKLPGTDVKNKLFNINNSKYSPDQLSGLADTVLKEVVSNQCNVILKYVPELELTEEMLVEFDINAKGSL